jgi:hypothetical protein
MTTEPLLHILAALERELHDPKVSGDRARLERLLHPEFREYGRSGTAYSRSETLGLLLSEQQTVEVHAQDFQLQAPSEGVALLTYRSAHVGGGGVLEKHSLRSSLWKLSATGWQLLFHQGTPTVSFNKNAL